jgi:hypothetical protein
MNAKFRNSMLALALFGGTALFAASALATDMNEGDFGGTYRYIGPGAASEPDIYVGPPFGADGYTPDVYAPELYAPEAYAAPYAAPPPDVTEAYIAPNDGLSPDEDYVPPPVQDYAPEEALVDGD